MIQQHEVARALRQQRECFADAAAVVDLQARIPVEHAGHALAEHRVIIHQQSPNHTLDRLTHPSTGLSIGHNSTVKQLPAGSGS